MSAEQFFRDTVLAGFINGLWDEESGETAQFEIFEQADERIAPAVRNYISAEGTQHRGALQWEIADGRIVARNLDWGF